MFVKLLDIAAAQAAWSDCPVLLVPLHPLVCLGCPMLMLPAVPAPVGLARAACACCSITVVMFPVNYCTAVILAGCTAVTALQ